MIFQHSRFQIWNQNQHPFVHSLSDFGYSNDSLPGVTNMETALNYITAVLYPNSKAAVATPGDLPLLGNTINDYRIVQDDGDGKAAGYRWEQREGEATPSWHKIYDLDWGTDSILQAWQMRTQDLYVHRRGYDDIDESGVAITGLLAGQRVFGGYSPNTNLTLSANAGDGAGPQTGYVQVTDDFRPTTNGTLSLGLNTFRFLKGWFNEGQFGTLNLQGGLITDSSGAISFDNENLSTTGSITSGTLVLSGGSITDTTGAISFGNENLTTTGIVTANSVSALGAASAFFNGTSIADFTFTNGNVSSLSTAVDFNALDLTTTGIFTGGRLNVDNVRIDGNTVSITDVNGNLVLAANGTGLINLSNALTTSSSISMTGSTLTLTGTTLNGTGQFNFDNLRIDGNTLFSTNSNGVITLQPDGTGVTEVGSDLLPTTTDTFGLGNSSQLWTRLWISEAIGDATNEFLIDELLTLKSVTFRDSARTIPAQAGDSLFFDGIEWLASVPDSEITHASLTGLTTDDAGHTQFALLAGRAGGQSLIGGTATGENLNLESTSHITKGFIQTKDTLRPFSDSTYSGGWTGIDLGHSGFRFNDVYTAGEFKGFRIENFGSLPAPSSQRVGRLAYLTTDGNVYVDTGTTLKQVGGTRFQTDTTWNGSDVLKDVTVSGTDARVSIWQLKDNANDFDVVYCSIKATSATNVRITLGNPLPAGTYRLIGV
jgi:hypothetical protein